MTCKRSVLLSVCSHVVEKKRAPSQGNFKPDCSSSRENLNGVLAFLGVLFAAGEHCAMQLQAAVRGFCFVAVFVFELVLLERATALCIIDDSKHVVAQSATIPSLRRRRRLLIRNRVGMGQSVCKTHRALD